jgi:ferredoxin
MTKITFITSDGTRHELVAETGTTLLEAAKKHGLPLLGTCGGSRICGTCHLIVKTEDFPRVGSPCSEEMDVLEWIPTFSETSRLGCQIKVQAMLDGLEVRIP